MLAPHSCGAGLCKRLRLRSDGKQGDGHDRFEVDEKFNLRYIASETVPRINTEEEKITDMAGNVVQHTSTGGMDKGLFQGVCIQPVQKTGLANYSRQANEDPQKPDAILYCCNKPTVVQLNFRIQVKADMMKGILERVQLANQTLGAGEW
jgi:hypothetical protein